MRPVPKNSFILSVHQLQCGHLQSTSLLPAHTFSSGAATACSSPGTQHVGCRLRPALQPSGCLLLTQNGVLSLPILLFEIERSRKMRDQVSKEAAASPQCIWISKTALNRASRCCYVRFLDIILAQIFLTPNSSVSTKRTVSRFMFISSAIILTVNRRPDRTSSLTRAALSHIRFAEGHPLRRPSSIWVLLSENILCQRNACALDIASSPKADWP